MIHQQNRPLIPVQTFRAQWKLPASFGVAYFEPKDWPVGSLEGSSALLLRVKEQVVAAIGPHLSITELPTTVERLTSLFEAELEAANVSIGLRPVEVDFAVSGFRDILQAAVYRLIQLFYTRPAGARDLAEAFDFSAVYQGWLNDSTRVSAAAHSYQHNDLLLEVRLIYNVYGRVGLEVGLNGETYDVLDMSLTCPAANFMRDLCEEVAQALCWALVYI